MIEKILFIILGWLLGILTDPIKKIFEKASVEIVFDEKNEKYKRKFSDQNIDFRIEVKNNLIKRCLFNNIIAKKCSVRITLPVNPNDIKNLGNAYINSKDELSKIEDEYILWDFQYEGKNPYALDIPPKSGNMATFAKFKYNNGDSFWEVPSENIKKPRINLASNELNFEISVYSENVDKVSKKIKIKKP